MKEIYVIAGEPSGDFLGSLVLKALKEDDISFSGVGGSLMKDEGLTSLFPMEEISIGGIVELIPHLLRVNRLINQTVSDILAKKPDIVLTIDSPGFCFRVAKLLRKQNPEIKLMHLVAPNVWAWRPKRAKRIARIYDHLLTLFDFEPIYFEKEGLKTTFVGHPAIERYNPSNSNKTETILIMPGSRVQEIKVLLPIFMEAAKSLGKSIVIPTLPHLVPLIKSIDNSIAVETDEDAKTDLYQKAKLALVASGTATLQLALAGCPMIVCYKISNISYKIIRKLVKVKFISLVNIILNRCVVPELIQDECTVNNIIKTAGIINLTEQMEEFKTIRQSLTDGNQLPSHKIASIILEEINR